MPVPAAFSSTRCGRFRPHDADGESAVPRFPLRPIQEGHRTHAALASVVDPRRPDRGREARGVGHRHRRRIARIAAVAVRAGQRRAVLRIPAGVAARDQRRDFVAVVGAVFAGEGLAGVAVPVGRKSMPCTFRCPYV